MEVVMVRRAIASSENKNLIYLAAALSLGAAFIHMLVIPEHLREWWGYGLFFTIAMLAQGVYGVLLIAQPWRYISQEDLSFSASRFTRVFYLLGILGNAALVSLYLVTRTVGIPFFGPEAGELEQVTPLSLVSKTMELALMGVLGALVLRTRVTPREQNDSFQRIAGEFKKQSDILKRTGLWIEGLLGVQSRAARVGTILFVMGTGITLLYHLVLISLGSSPELESDLIAYAIHTLAFGGMLVLFAGYFLQEQRGARDTFHAPPIPPSSPFNLNSASVDSRWRRKENIPDR